jgi:hypothetical protein
VFSVFPENEYVKNKTSIFMCVCTIIILRVGFCSDIWYCNILTYYLDN